MQLQGIHHVTAVTGLAAQNVAFYTQVLGMRLVKKTVNQDDLSAYHLFYADAAGNPAPISPFLTGRKQCGTAPAPAPSAATGLRVPGQALDWWTDISIRLACRTRGSWSGRAGAR